MHKKTTLLCRAAGAVLISAALIGPGVAQSGHNHHHMGGDSGKSMRPLTPLPQLSAPETKPSGHDHGHSSGVGRQGKPGLPARVVQVTMGEADGRMVFIPDRLDVRRNEQIKFLIRNVGELDHEFILGTTKENLAHLREMEKHPDMAHDEPTGVRLAPGKSGEILWKFDKRGGFEFACLIPGHREAGMVGRIDVK